MNTEIHATNGWPFLLAYDESGEKCLYKTPILACANNVIAHDLIRAKCVEDATIKPMVQRFAFLYKERINDGKKAFSCITYPDLSQGSLQDHVIKMKQDGVGYIILLDFMTFKFISSTPDGIIQFLGASE